MFQLLPAVETMLLPFLPVEMWVTILRLLDPKSLLAGVRAYKLWMSVCLGDAVLKQRLREALEEEAYLARKFLVDPKMSIRVVRTTTAGKYATNIQKVVTIVPKPAAMDFPKPDVYDAKKRKTRKSSKGKSSNRFCPYRL